MSEPTTSAIGPACRRLLQRCRGAFYWRWISRWGAALFLMVVLFFGVEAALDQLVDLSAGVRIAALRSLGLLLVLGTVTGAFFIWRWRSDLRFYVRTCERQIAGLSGGLGALLDPAQPLEPAVRDILTARCEQAAERVPPTHNFAGGPAVRLHLFLSGALAFFLLSALMLGPGYFHSLARCLFPFAPTTATSALRIVEVSPGDAVIAQGRELPVQVRLMGSPPAPLTLHVDGAEPVDIRLEHGRGNVWSGAIPARAADYRYWVRYGAGATSDAAGPFSVQVLARLRVERVEVDYREFPSYSGLLPRVEAARHVDAPVGSHVVVDIFTSGPVDAVTADWQARGLDAARTVELERQAPGRWRLPFDVRSGGEWRLRLRSKQAPDITGTVAVVARADRAPRVELSLPPEAPSRVYDIKDTPDFTVFARDDHGLQSVKLVLVLGTFERRMDLVPSDARPPRQILQRLTVDAAEMLEEMEDPEALREVEPGVVELTAFVVAADNHVPEQQSTQSSVEVLRLRLDSDRGTSRRLRNRRLKNRDPRQHSGGGGGASSEQREPPSRAAPDSLNRDDGQPKPPPEQPAQEGEAPEYAAPPGGSGDQPKPPPQQQPPKPPEPSRKGDRSKSGGQRGEPGDQGASGGRTGQNDSDPFGPNPMDDQSQSPQSQGGQPSPSGPSQSSGEGGGNEPGGAVDGPGPERMRDNDMPTGNETGRSDQLRETIIEERVDELDVSAEDARREGSGLEPGADPHTQWGREGESRPNDMPPADEANPGATDEVRSIDAGGHQLPAQLQEQIKEQVPPAYRKLVEEYFRRRQ